MRTLFAWIGGHDLKSSREDTQGPIATALEQRAFDLCVLLNNYARQDAEHYIEWLRLRTDTTLDMTHVDLSSPIDFDEIYRTVSHNIDNVREQVGAGLDMTFHLSPGTPAMSAVWVILSKSRYPAALIQTYLDDDGKSVLLDVSLPFELSAEYIGDLLRHTDDELIRSSQGLPKVDAAFEDIIYRCEPMQRVISRAQRAASRTVPVLIQGESGTGKELFARAIHDASPRKNKPFIPINCGAIPRELVESEFFGHTKGAFTGATQAHDGAFQTAHEGTLFLDEIGELPADQQVKLLRALQESKVRPVGASHEYEVDVRVICATNRNLYDEVYEGNFREDLFHRLAVAILDLPPLREREGDLSILIDALLKDLNVHHVAETKGVAKQLAPAARQVFLNHSWPGNIRELRNTLLRALIWSGDAAIDEHEAREAILRRPPEHVGVLEHDLGGEFDIQRLEEDIRRHYIHRALNKAGGNKTTAGRLLGNVSQQTLSNWMSKLGISTDME
jgi:transcriptional regulator with GAF, ATPase, and Fis domain